MVKFILEENSKVRDRGFQWRFGHDIVFYFLPSIHTLEVQDH